MFDKLFYLFFALMAIFIFMNLVGCTNVVNQPPPPPPCDPALTCVLELGLGTSDPNCATVIVGSQPLFFRASNGHPTRDIWASFLTTVQYLNQPVPTTITTTLVFIPHANASDLGCQITKNADDTLDQWQFVLSKACFTDDPTCQPSAVLPPHSKNSVCSLSQCTGPFCIHYAFNSVPGNTVEQQAGHDAAKAAQELLIQRPPFSVNLSSLFGLTTACSNTPNLSIDQHWSFSGQGNSCGMQLPLTYDPNLNLNWVVFDIDSSVHGTLKAVSTNERDLVFDDPAQSIQMSWINKNNKLLGSESVTKMMVAPQHLTIVGSTTYCIQIDLPNP